MSKVQKPRQADRGSYIPCYDGVGVAVQPIKMCALSWDESMHVIEGWGGEHVGNVCIKRRYIEGFVSR